MLLYRSTFLISFAPLCRNSQVLIENQLEMEKMKVETGKKKISLLHEQLHDKVKRLIVDGWS